MSYDLKSHKIVAIVSSKEPAHVALNVVGHLGIALGALVPRGDLMGRPTLVDKSGIAHPGIARYSFIVKAARPTKLYQAITAARDSSDVTMVDYPRAMLDTGHDDELNAMIEAATETDLDYLGAMLFGPSTAVDEICGKFTLWQPSQ